EERAYCDASARPAAHYACRFAAREAVLKSLGAGFGQEGVGRNDVCTSRDSNGKPIAVLSGGAQAVAERLGVQEVAISL
ncbi:holo-ACP synthase, partial [Escherichia coli]